jgi:hypothetical protein
MSTARTVGELADRCVQIVDLLAYQHLPGTGVKSRLRLVSLRYRGDHPAAAVGCQSGQHAPDAAAGRMHEYHRVVRDGDGYV